MTCAKWAVSVMSLVVIVLSLWSILSQETTKWIIVVLSIIIVLTVWLGTVCKCDLMEKPKKSKR